MVEGDEMKIIKKIIMCILCLVLLFISIASIKTHYYERPHRISNNEELVELIPEFKKLEIESCDCYWQGDVVAWGGVLECHSSGKITVSYDFYNRILKEYTWIESSGMPYSNLNSAFNIDQKACESFKAFVKGTYLISDDFQKEYYSIILLSKVDNSIYFYRYEL